MNPMSHYPNPTYVLDLYYHLVCWPSTLPNSGYQHRNTCRYHDECHCQPFLAKIYLALSHAHLYVRKIAHLPRKLQGMVPGIIE